MGNTLSYLVNNLFISIYHFFPLQPFQNKHYVARYQLITTDLMNLQQWNTTNVNSSVLNMWTCQTAFYWTINLSNDAHFYFTCGACGHENTHYVWFKTDKEACCTSPVLFASTDVKHLFLGLQSEHISPAEVERPSVSLQRVPRWLPGPGSLNVRLHLEAWSILRQREGSALPRGHHWQQALKNIQEWKCPLFNQVRLQHQSK